MVAQFQDYNLPTFLPNHSQILLLLTLLALLTCAVHQFIKILFKILLLIVILVLYIASIIVLALIFERHCEPW